MNIFWLGYSEPKFSVAFKQPPPMSRVSNRQSALLTATISRRSLTLFARNNGTNCRFDLNSNREFKQIATADASTAIVTDEV